MNSINLPIDTIQFDIRNRLFHTAHYDHEYRKYDRLYIREILKYYQLMNIKQQLMWVMEHETTT